MQVGACSAADEVATLLLALHILHDVHLVQSVQVNGLVSASRIGQLH